MTTDSKFIEKKARISIKKYKVESPLFNENHTTDEHHFLEHVDRILHLECRFDKNYIDNIGDISIDKIHGKSLGELSIYFEVFCADFVANDRQKTEKWFGTPSIIYHENPLADARLIGKFYIVNRNSFNFLIECLMGNKIDTIFIDMNLKFPTNSTINYQNPLFDEKTITGKNQKIIKTWIASGNILISKVDLFLMH